MRSTLLARMRSSVLSAVACAAAGLAMAEASAAPLPIASA